MPTYDFIDYVTGKEWSEFMSIADMETFIGSCNKTRRYYGNLKGK